MRQTTKEIEEVGEHTVNNNLSLEHKHALKTVNNMEITIKASDKGGNVVLMDNSNYENVSEHTK